MSELHIFRGLPGSGKSTAARALGIKHYEADMFFEDYAGNYCYEPERIDDAHKWCKRKVQQALAQGSDVAVSNIFQSVWQMEDYISIAERAGARVFIHECHGNFGNVHDVPEDAIERMRQAWEDVPQSMQHLLVR